MQRVGQVLCRQGCREQQYPKVDWLRIQVRTATSKGAKPEDIVASYERWGDWVAQVQAVRSPCLFCLCMSCTFCYAVGRYAVGSS